MTIADVVRKFNFPILLVLSVVLLEYISRIIGPTFFGHLPDILIEKFYDKENVNYLLPLCIWFPVFLAYAAGGTLHRLFRGKIFALAVPVIVPIGVINNICRKNVVTLLRSLHDSRVDQYRGTENGDTPSIKAYFYSMVHPQSETARRSSIDYLIIKVLLMVIFSGGLFIAVDVDKFAA